MAKQSAKRKSKKAKGLNSNKKGLMLLEDNASLANQISSRATKLGFIVFEARSVEKAKELINTKKKEIHAAIIDLMVPDREVDVEALDDALEGREKLIVEATENGENLRLEIEQLIDLRDRLSAQDRQISEFVNENGGLVVLEEIQREKGREFSENQTVFISARDPAKAPTKEARKKLDPEGQVRWIVKPISPDKLSELITSLLRND